MYFGVSCEKTLANFQHDHWRDIFTQWQKHHPNHGGTKGVLVICSERLHSVSCLGHLL